MRFRAHRRGLSGVVVACAIVLASTATSTQTRSSRPPGVGDKAPDFTLPLLDGARLTLSAELARGPVVLIVGRGWVGYQCPFCNRQFNDFVKAARAIEDAGARVLWIYPGRTDEIQQRAAEFAAGRSFPANFRLLLDPDFTFTLPYGLRWDAPGETAYPATFVIDRSGIVRFALVSRSHAGRASASDVLAALNELKKAPSVP